MSQLSAQVRDPLHSLWLTLLLASTPLAVILAFTYDYPKEWCAVGNSYAFSTAFLGLYLSPLLSPFVTGNPTWKNRLALSTENWILYLTCFTELIQIVHSLSPQTLHTYLDQPHEWAFYSYSLSDSRWRDYTPDRGQTFTLPFEVNLINWNDGLLGIICITLWAWSRAKPSHESHYSLVLAVLFRDATLWRETVEYLWQHHRGGYAYTTSDPLLRPHAIYLLWGINGLWLIAPLLSCVWAWHEIMSDRGAAVGSASIRRTTRKEKEIREYTRKRD